ncbi:hypothetical protein SAMN05216302_101482 [Nitrosomonas aestuarii]|uniref:Uncharacterized protein n=1 Tax=Nitrosomonas aestuarii TaxID=52441 RepID=A0A1I4C4I5_9PROT|nr:hypothetical protein [Nitrosomonas aestuarii]SFK75683.1 hypothetical protein SAMN05216302_101482 [Nitrosomonas aestuarii]
MKNKRVTEYAVITERQAIFIRDQIESLSKDDDEISNMIASGAIDTAIIKYDLILSKDTGSPLISDIQDNDDILLCLFSIFLAGFSCGFKFACVDLKSRISQIEFTEGLFKKVNGTEHNEMKKDQE